MDKVVTSLASLSGASSAKNTSSHSSAAESGSFKNLLRENQRQKDSQSASQRQQAKSEANSKSSPKEISRESAKETPEPERVKSELRERPSAAEPDKPNSETTNSETRSNPETRSNLETRASLSQAQKPNPDGEELTSNTPTSATRMDSLFSENIDLLNPDLSFPLSESPEIGSPVIDSLDINFVDGATINSKSAVENTAAIVALSTAAENSKAANISVATVEVAGDELQIPAVSPSSLRADDMSVSSQQEKLLAQTIAPGLSTGIGKEGPPDAETLFKGEHLAGVPALGDASKKLTANSAFVAEDPANVKILSKDGLSGNQKSPAELSLNSRAETQPVQASVSNADHKPGQTRVEGLRSEGISTKEFAWIEKSQPFSAVQAQENSLQSSAPNSLTAQGGLMRADATRMQMPVNITFGQAEWAGQIAERSAMMASQKITFAELQLDPPELGSLQVRVSVSHEQASVSFASPHQSVRDALDQSVIRLRDLMEQQGLNLVDVNVSDKHEHQQAESEKSEHEDVTGDESKLAESQDDSGSITSVYGVDYYV